MDENKLYDGGTLGTLGRREVRAVNEGMKRKGMSN
jgi:hypothetical protein